MPQVPVRIEGSDYVRHGLTIRLESVDPRALTNLVRKLAEEDATLRVASCDLVARNIEEKSFDAEIGLEYRVLAPAPARDKGISRTEEESTSGP